MGTISILHIILILFIHFIADFLCQSRTMATKKSTSVYWLSAHVGVYTLVTFMGWVLFLSIDDGYDNDFGDFLLRVFVTIYNYGFQLLLFTYVSHWVTDFITSKITTHYYKQEKWFEFFTVIGIDQFIHATTLLLTYGYLIS